MSDRSPHILFGFQALALAMQGRQRPLNAAEKLTLTTSFLKHGADMGETMRRALLAFLEVEPAFYKEAAVAFHEALQRCISQNDRDHVDEMARMANVPVRFAWQERADLQ